LAAQHIFCSTKVSDGEAVVHGIIAAAAAIGLGSGLGTGFPAAAFAFISASPEARSDAINRGLGVGFLFGLVVGVFFFAIFASKLVT
jgi:hypothetical protein